VQVLGDVLVCTPKLASSFKNTQKKQIQLALRISTEGLIFKQQFAYFNTPYILNNFCLHSSLSIKGNIRSSVQRFKQSNYKIFKNLKTSTDLKKYYDIGLGNLVTLEIFLELLNFIAINYYQLTKKYTSEMYFFMKIELNKLHRQSLKCFL